jgi:hypothetical protein
MSTAAITANWGNQQASSYFQQRRTDMQQLSQDLQSGNLTAAQQDFSALQTLGQSGPFANGDVFKASNREQDFSAIGQALQSGDLAGAQQALAQLQSTFPQGQSTAPQPVAAPISNTPASGPEIVLNLGNMTPGEQITIGLSPTTNGNEQVTIGVANQQNQAPEQITVNLNPNSNEQIVLNLLNGVSTSTSSTRGSGLSVSA